MTLSNIEHRITIEAPRERVWQALTDPDQVARWLGCMNYKGTIGCVFHMQPDPERRAAGSIQDATHCELLRLEEHQMVFSWYLPGTPKTEVSITLKEQGGGATEVVLVHRGWEQFDPAQIKPIWEALNSGWESGVLPNLKALVE